MANVQLSKTVKKLSQDFAFVDGQYKMSLEKMTLWSEELEKAPKAERPKLAQELIALARKFEREGKGAAGVGMAQLYFFAAGALADAPAPPKKPTATQRSETKTVASKPAAKPAAAAASKSAPAKPEKASGGWGAKSKR